MTKQTTILYLLQPHGTIPNNPQLPLLVCEQVFSRHDNLVKQFKEAFQQNNWRGGESGHPDTWWPRRQRNRSKSRRHAGAASWHVPLSPIFRLRL